MAYRFRATHHTTPFIESSLSSQWYVGFLHSHSVAHLTLLSLDRPVIGLHSGDSDLRPSPNVELVHQDTPLVGAHLLWTRSTDQSANQSQQSSLSSLFTTLDSSDRCSPRTAKPMLLCTVYYQRLGILSASGSSNSKNHDGPFHTPLFRSFRSTLV